MDAITNLGDGVPSVGEVTRTAPVLGRGEACLVSLCPRAGCRRTGVKPDLGCIRLARTVAGLNKVT
jgi:hypothetical protein